VFTTLILMTGITVAIPYGFSALAQIKWRIVDRREMHGQRFARDMVVAVLALIFSVGFIYYSRNTGHSWFTYWAPFLLAGVALLIGIPVYVKLKNQMTEPGPVPEYR
jgi:basic amino acid/polyamine antiporter, APA family